MRKLPRLSLIAGGVLVLLGCVPIVCAQQATKQSVAPGFLTALEVEVVQEINLARANPGQYAGYLEECRQYYKGKSYLPPSRTKPVTTLDGVAAVDEAILFLKGMSPLGPLQPSPGLSLGARDHAQDMALKGTNGHRGSDGSLPNDRISRYGAWKSTVGEAILYRVGTAREMVLDLIIDDGNPERPHRKNVFESSFQVTGVSISPESNHGSFCVIDYAGGFVEKAGSNAAPAAAPAAKPTASSAETTMPATTAETKPSAETNTNKKTNKGTKRQ